MKISRRSLLAAPAVAFATEPVRLPKKVRVAVWGLDGHASEITVALPQFPDVEIVGVQDANAAAAEKYARGKARVFADPRRMLDELKPDIVAVCNNDGERAAAIVECASRKVHVMAEKPLSINRADLEKVKRSVAANGVKLGMLMPMRFYPWFLALKQITESGEIGEVIQIAAQKSYKLGVRPEWQKKRATYGSTILWIGIHMFDLMRWCSGREMKSASSFMGIAGPPRADEMENTTVTCFRLDNNGTAALHMDYARPETAPTHGDDRLRLAGTKGVAEYMAATGVTLVTDKAKPARIEKLPEARSIFAEFLEHVYTGKPTSLPHAEIYRLCEITLAAHEAAVTNKVVAL